MTYNTPVLLRIKYWTVWYIERYSKSTYTGVTNSQIQSGFFGPPCIYIVLRFWLVYQRVTSFGPVHDHDSNLITHLTHDPLTHFQFCFKPYIFCSCNISVLHFLILSFSISITTLVSESTASICCPAGYGCGIFSQWACMHAQMSRRCLTVAWNKQWRRMQSAWCGSCCYGDTPHPERSIAVITQSRAVSITQCLPAVRLSACCLLHVALSPASKQNIRSAVRCHRRRKPAVKSGEGLWWCRFFTLVTKSAPKWKKLSVLDKSSNNSRNDAYLLDSKALAETRPKCFKVLKRPIA